MNNFLTHAPSYATRHDPAHAARITEQLKAHGVTRFGLWRAANRYMANVIHHDEDICAVVYGRRDQTSAMLIATDRRLIFLDKKPLFVSEDDIAYDVVSGISYGQAGFAATVTLHTRLGDYKLHTLNQQCASHFVRYIETHCLEGRHQNPRTSWNYSS